MFLFIAIALVGMLVYYRRRVMEPFTRRYEQGPPGSRPGDEEDPPSS